MRMGLDQFDTVFKDDAMSIDEVDLVLKTPEQDRAASAARSNISRLELRIRNLGTSNPGRTAQLQTELADYRRDLANATAGRGAQAPAERAQNRNVAEQRAAGPANGRTWVNGFYRESQSGARAWVPGYYRARAS